MLSPVGYSYTCLMIQYLIFYFNSIETINPHISGIPENIVQNTDANSPTATVTWTPPTASDNFGVVTLSTNHESGSTFPIGSTTVTYVATDLSLNQVSSSFIIIITGMAP